MGWQLGRAVGCTNIHLQAYAAKVECPEPIGTMWTLQRHVSMVMDE
jgi:hypothetical protein